MWNIRIFSIKKTLHFLGKNVFFDNLISAVSLPYSLKLLYKQRALELVL